jgi:hypothetical protein
VHYETGKWQRLAALLAGTGMFASAWGADPAGAAPPPATTQGAAAPAATPAPTVSGTSASDDELRNTLINLLEALVQKGVLTREQAQGLVADAQAKAAAAAKEQSTKDAADAAEARSAVRVTYVPQIVKDQIETDVANQVSKQVATQVVQTAKSQGWGVPGALPDWIRNVRVYGDARVRTEYDAYAAGNAQGFYLNLQAVNTAGGIGKAGLNSLLDTSESRPYLFGRLRLGVLAQLADDLKSDLRITSGNAVNPISTNQTLGDYSGRWTLGVDRAALLWTPHTRSWNQDADVRLGRFENPFVTGGEMIWDVDVSFEGLSATWDWNRIRGWDERASRWLWVTGGSFLLQSPSQLLGYHQNDKWLYAGQIGSEIPFSWDSKLRVAAAYYDFSNITGRPNAPDSNLLDWTAPLWLTKGNTLFDIRNDTDPSTNLFALAGKYRLLTGLVQLDLLAFGDNHVILSGEYVKNIGWKSADVLARTGSLITARTKGYETGISVGAPRVYRWGQWRAGLSYRYLERDAVLDAFTDSDFHLGGTDARGYILVLDLGLGRSAFLRARYLSANEINGAPLGINVGQLDFVGQF